jgi:hypothetical protein
VLKKIEILGDDQVLPGTNQSFEIKDGKSITPFRVQTQLELVGWLNSLIKCTRPDKRAPLIPLKNEKRNEIMQMLTENGFGVKTTSLSRNVSKAKFLPERPKRISLYN